MRFDRRYIATGLLKINHDEKLEKIEECETPADVEETSTSDIEVNEEATETSVPDSEESPLVEEPKRRGRGKKKEVVSEENVGDS